MDQELPGGARERWELVTRSPRETRRLARALGEATGAGLLVCLRGGLGVGKTVFVQGLAAGLRVAEPVTSPSFVLVQPYTGRMPLYHVDLFRLDAAAARGLGLEEMLDAGGVLAIEWAERMPPELGQERIEVEISFGAGERERHLDLCARGAAPAALLRLVKGRWRA